MKENLGKLLLRITVGGLMLFHGFAKIIHGIDFIKDTLIAKGLPEIMGYGVYIGEVVGPIMLIIGFRSRLAGIIVAFDMLTAIYLVHMKDIFGLTGVGAWAIEIEMFYLLSSVSIVLLGSGKYAIKED